MAKVVTEAELDGLRHEDFERVLLVRSADELAGVEVIKPGRLTPFVAPDRAGSHTRLEDLLVLVDDPDSEEVMGRVRLKLGLRTYPP